MNLSIRLNTFSLDSFWGQSCVLRSRSKDKASLGIRSTYRYNGLKGQPQEDLP